MPTVPIPRPASAALVAIVALGAITAAYCAPAVAADANMVAKMSTQWLNFTGSSVNADSFQHFDQWSANYGGGWYVTVNGKMGMTGAGSLTGASNSVWDPDVGAYLSSGASDLWLGDVITIRVPGAGPTQRTRVRLQVKFHATGTGSSTGQGSAALAFCFRQSASDCPTDGDVEGRLTLPAPDHVVTGTSGTIQTVPGAWGPYGLRQEQSRIVTVEGPEATIPIWAHFSSTIVSGQEADALSFSNSAAWQWTLTLPGGASCTSRSGVAFKHLCPGG
jgi:hypothetical protein